MKTTMWIIVAFIAVGLISGGVVRRPDGTVDVPATFDQGATKGGEIAGQAADDVGDSIGHSIGSAVSSSDLAKVGVAGAAAAGVVKYGPKITRPSIKLRPIDDPALTPTTKPKAPKPETTTPTMAPTTTTAAPMSGGFTAPTFRVPEATWKPCVATPGILVSC